VSTRRKEKKRFFEVVIMLLATILILLITRLETRLYLLTSGFGANKEFTASLFYFALINLNVILILVLSFLIFRNISRLIIERRRGVLGSKLGAKLIFSLVFFAIAPSLTLAYVSTDFISKSMVGWFSDQVTSTIKLARESGAAAYQQDQKRLKSIARLALQKIDTIQPEPQILKEVPSLTPKGLRLFVREYSLSNALIYQPSGSMFWSSERGFQNQVPLEQDLFAIESSEQFQLNPQLTALSTVEVRGGRDIVKGSAPIFHPKSGYFMGVVVVEETFEGEILARLEAVLGSFARLRPESQLIQINYLILMALMLLLILFSAIWLGFYVAKGITGPLQKLSEATREVALGNYKVDLKVHSDDETGQLLRAFNTMVKDIEFHQLQNLDARASLEKSNQEISERKNYTEVVLDSISAGVISIDKSGIIGSINGAAERLLKINGTHAAGKRPDEALGASLYTLFLDPIIRALDHSPYYNSQVHLDELGRTEILIVRARTLMDSLGSPLGYVIVFDDAQDQVRSQKAAAWKEVARRIAHEIKNPITPIKLNAQRLLRKFEGQFQGDDRELFKKLLNSILAQVDSLRDLVNEFSTFSRMPEISLKENSIEELLTEVLTLFKQSYPQVNWTSEIESVPRFYFDRDQLGRVLMNLFGNSIAALSLERPGEIGVKVFSRETMLVIQILDNGCGVDDSMKEKIFEAYVSTRADGTGLGLSIVRQVIVDHGGSVRVLDNQNFGTIVEFDIPLRTNDLKLSGESPKIT
jgi:two-component system nitrogen regulation sensor histidine kinase NtrY